MCKSPSGKCLEKGRGRHTSPRKGQIVHVSGVWIAQSLMQLLSSAGGA